jgi:hypothetical protein
VSPKRGDDVAPPPAPGEWRIRFLENDTCKGWDELCRQAPGNTLSAWQTMRRSPAPPVHDQRHHPLHKDLATGFVKGRVLQRWQIEVTGSGRIWYFIDPDEHTVWIDYAGCGHPRQTA